jgi:hypothetical protein
MRKQRGGIDSSPREFGEEALEFPPEPLRILRRGSVLDVVPSPAQ